MKKRKADFQSIIPQSTSLPNVNQPNEQSIEEVIIHLPPGPDVYKLRGEYKAKAHRRFPLPGNMNLEESPTQESKQARPNKKSLHLNSMGSEEDPREYDRTRQLFKNGLIVMEVAGGMACFLLIFWIFVYAGGKPWFGGKPINLHVIIMVVFLFYLHGHAALIYRIFPQNPKPSIKLLHAGLHLLVCIAAAVGLAAAVQHHNMTNAPHFYSFHSWLGLCAIIIYYGQFIGGFVAFLLPTTPPRIRALVLPIHRVSGQAAFAFCAGSVITGVMLKALGTIGTEYQNLPSSGLVINFGGFFALLYSICVGSLVSDYRFRRRPRPEGELLLSDAGDAE